MEGGLYHFDNTDNFDGPTEHDVPPLTAQEERLYRGIIRRHMREDRGFRDDVRRVHPGRGLGRLSLEEELGFAFVAQLEEAVQRRELH